MAAMIGGTESPPSPPIPRTGQARGRTRRPYSLGMDVEETYSLFEDSAIDLEHLLIGASESSSSPSSESSPLRLQASKHQLDVDEIDWEGNPFDVGLDSKDDLYDAKIKSSLPLVDLTWDKKEQKEEEEEASSEWRGTMDFSFHLGQSNVHYSLIEDANVSSPEFSPLFDTASPPSPLEIDFLTSIQPTPSPAPLFPPTPSLESLFNPSPSSPETVGYLDGQLDLHDLKNNPFSILDSPPSILLSPPPSPVEASMSVRSKRAREEEEDNVEEGTDESVKRSRVA